MDQKQVNQLLKRRMFLQRYVNQLAADARKINSPFDRELVAELRDFIDNASEAEIQALTRQRKSSQSARKILSRMREIVRAQHNGVRDLMRAELSELAELESNYVANVIGITASAKGVAAMPTGGQSLDDAVRNSYGKYHTRLVSEVTQTAATDPQKLGLLIVGSAALRRQDGLVAWRDNRLIRPLVDVAVNGTAANASEYAYERANIDEVDVLATLDFRVCESCANAEANGPYQRGRHPRLSLHPYCRCIIIPRINKPSRPTVRDSRSVKDIPASERTPGKIGTTKDSMVQFWNSWNDSERRDYLGPARFQLYKQGKIRSLKDLVNPVTLEPLKLSQLPQP